jgi:hypothetical protein
MQTYFAQVICPKADHQDELEDDIFAVEIGLRPKEIQDVDQFKRMLETQAREAGVAVELTTEIIAMLYHDQLAALPPTDLQRWGLNLVAQYEKRVREGR